MNHIAETKRMMIDGLAVVTNPEYLTGELVAKTDNELKEMRKDDGQLTSQAQHEMSLRGDRLALIEFHRYLYTLTNDDIERLWEAKKQFCADTQLSEDENTYCDVNLLVDAVQYQLCIRFEKWFDQMTADQIARSFRQNLKLAANFPEITSQHMLQLVSKMFKSYTPETIIYTLRAENPFWRQVKAHAALKGTTIKQLILDLLRKEIGLEEEGKS